MDSGGGFLVGFAVIGLWSTAMFYPVWRKRVLLWSLCGFLYWGFCAQNISAAPEYGRWVFTLGWNVWGL